MKHADIKELSTDEIRERITFEHDNYVQMKLHHAVSPLENPLKLRYSRRMIARLKTEFKNRKDKEIVKTSPPKA